MIRSIRIKCVGMIVLWLVGVGGAGAQATDGSIVGRVVDQLGAGAESTVVLLRDGEPAGEARSDSSGEFRFGSLRPGRYRLQAVAQGFTPAFSELVFVGDSSEARVRLTLHVGPIEQYVVVTAAATELPQSLVGSPVTVVDRARLESLGKPDVLEALRTVPGTHVLQTGQRGGATAVFVRGGAPDFAKVLIDGVPADDIGGAFDFGTLLSAGVETVEVLRTANSVQHGPDALSGVVSVTTRRGRTPRPELTYSIDGGNLGTLRQEVSLGGVADRIDYYFAASRFDTDNDLPNNDYRNGTLSGRFGVALGGATDLRVTVRHLDTALGLPGAVLFNGLVDDTSQEEQLTFMGVTARSQIGDRWRSTIRFASADQGSQFVDPAPTGEPFDPFGVGADFLGDPVTIEGANGFSVSGRAIMNFGFGGFPSVFETDTSRRSLSGQVDYLVSDALELSGGARIEDEYGVQDGTFGMSSTERTNTGGFLEARASLGHRAHITAGVGFEDNEVFGSEATPRLSAAVYVRTPDPSRTIFGDTKLTVNAGQGIKAPDVFDELNSIFATLSVLPNGTALISRGRISPIGPERSRSFDVGLEQGLWEGRARARVAFFHNEFSDPDRVREQDRSPRARNTAGGCVGSPVRRDGQRGLLPCPRSGDITPGACW